MFSKSLERKIARRYSTLGCVYMQVLFTRVNEVETSYELFRLNVKLSEVQLLLVRAIFHALISSLLFSNVNFTGGRGTQQIFIRGGSLLYTIFHEKGTPFAYLLLTNGTPFTYLV